MSDEEYSSEEEIDEVEEVTDLSNRYVVLRRWIESSCRSIYSTLPSCFGGRKILS